MDTKQPAVYLLANKRNGTLYVGVTSDLVKRIWQHKKKHADGFTKKHDVDLLVYYEQHESMEVAIRREKRLKEWPRKWKMDLIERENPKWMDLYPSLFDRAEIVALDTAVEPRYDEDIYSATQRRDRRVQSVLGEAVKRLDDVGIDTAALDARLLLQHVLRCDHAALVREPQRELSDDETNGFDALVARRMAREPLAHIVGTRDFWRDSFIVSRDVLTPRPDSETLIEAMLQQRPDKTRPNRIVDLGTGSGCLLLSLLREYEHAQGLGVDRSAAALAIAQRNAQQLGLAHRAAFVCADWMQTLQTRYDMVITNPPYIPAAQVALLEPEVKEYEPMAALSGGDDGLEAYHQILHALPERLADDGIAMVELGYGQCDAVSEIAAANGLRVIAQRNDLAGIARALVIGHK